MQSSHETTTSELEKTHEDEKSELKSTRSSFLNSTQLIHHKTTPLEHRYIRDENEGNAWKRLWYHLEKSELKKMYDDHDMEKTRQEKELLDEIEALKFLILMQNEERREMQKLETTFQWDAISRGRGFSWYLSRCVCLCPASVCAFIAVCSLSCCGIKGILNAMKRHVSIGGVQEYGLMVLWISLWMMLITGREPWNWVESMWACDEEPSRERCCAGEWLWSVVWVRCCLMLLVLLFFLLVSFFCVWVKLKLSRRSKPADFFYWYLCHGFFELKHTTVAVVYTNFITKVQKE